MKAWNFKNELARKAVHLLTLFIILIYFFVSETFSSKIALLLLVLLLIISIEFEYLRIEVGRKIPILNKVWAYTRRSKEKNTFGGDVFFLLGSILVLAVFDTKIAVAAILMTTFGDLSAALIGSKFGKHYITPRKAWEGIIAEFVVDIIVGVFVFIVYMPSLFIWEAAIIILVMSFTATLVESIVSKLDDNLLIPVFAGFNGQIILLIIEYFRIT